MTTLTWPTSTFASVMSILPSVSFSFMSSFELQPLPTWDLEQGMFRAWWFDPLVATLSFAVFINWYWYHERRLGLSNVSKLGAGVLSATSQPMYATVGYWIGIYLWRILVPPAGGGNPLPDGVPGNLTDLAYLMAEIVAGIVLYDFYFFGIHWAMHHVPILRHIHRDHHDTSKGTLESRDVVRHSFVDAALQVYVNIMVQRHTPWGAVKSRCARALHNMLVIWFLTESHTASPTPYIWRRWFVGIREHRIHHLGHHSHNSKQHSQAQDTSSFQGGVHHRYQQFFGYLDDLRSLWIQYQQQSNSNSTKEHGQPNMKNQGNEEEEKSSPALAPTNTVWVPEERNDVHHTKNKQQQEEIAAGHPNRLVTSHQRHPSLPKKLA